MTWAAALDAAARARVTVVVGQSDTGKTSLIARLASALAAEAPVAIVDADLGQSEIGPPTTVGLGRVTAAVARPGAAEILAARFVGATTPVRCIRELAAAAGTLAARARDAGYARVLVDTCGLVTPPFGVAVKRALVSGVGADAVIAVERDQECAALVQAVGARCPVVRVAASSEVIRRTAEQRRRFRVSAFARHLTGAREVTLDPARVPLRTGCGRAPDSDPTGAVLGLAAEDGDLVGLAVLKRIDADARRCVVVTAADMARVATVTIGEATLEETVIGDAPA